MPIFAFMSKYILMIDCPDCIGLVYKITGLLYEKGLNIVQNDEFVAKESEHFFMRTVVEGEFEETSLLDSLKSILSPEANIRICSPRKKNIVIFATKESHCLGDLLIRYKYGEIPANIQAVISNHNHLQSLVGALGIPFHYISHENISRSEHEAAIVRTLDVYQPDYLVLAKYMRILQPGFVENYHQRIINIHHSFLPAFIGANPYKQAYQRGVKIIGATAHFVNNDLDEGPIISQDVIPIDHKMSVRDMSRAGKDVEKIVLAKALRLVLEDRIFIHGNKTVIF